MSSSLNCAGLQKFVKQNGGNYNECVKFLNPYGLQYLTPEQQECLCLYCPRIGNARSLNRLQQHLGMRSHTNVDLTFGVL
jgi:hypothetical protein